MAFALNSFFPFSHFAVALAAALGQSEGRSVNHRLFAPAFLLKVTVLLLVVALAWGVIPAPVLADSYNVACDADAFVAGHALLLAFENANDTPGDDTITLAPGCLYQIGDTIDPYNSQPTHIKFENGVGTITLLGNGATIQQTSTYGVAEVWGNASAVIDGVTLTGGDKVDPQLGGGLFVDDNGTLVMTNSTITGNTAFQGGGFYTRGTNVTLTNVTISNNSATDRGANVAADVVGLETFTMNGVTISGGATPGMGGGMYVSGGGLVTLSNGSVSNNTGSLGGGGIANFGRVAVYGSTLTGNSGANGGAIYNGGSPFSVTNSTIAGNTATTAGGGVYSNAPALIEFSTLSANSAPAGGNIFHSGAPLNIQNIISANHAGGGDCVTLVPPGFVSLYSLVEDGGCGVAPGSGNLNGDPSLGPLANNGGGTLTFALLPGSIALDAGSNALVPAGLTTDQTGAARIQGASVDMGSVEGVGTGASVSVSSISRAGASPTNAASVSWTVTFSGSVTGVTAANFSLVTSGLTGASISNVSGSGTTWTVTASTGTGDGTLGLNMANAAGVSPIVSNLPFTGETYTIDKTAPAAAISSAAADPTNANPIPVTVTFSEAVSGFVAGDVVVGNGAVSNFAGGPAVYTFDVTPAADGLVTVDVAAAVANDAAGNGNTAAAQFSITYDTTAPTVAISSAAVSPTNANPIPVTVTFSEEVTGFALADLVVGNGTAAAVSSTGSVYTFAVTPAADGPVTVDVAAAVAVDAANNPNAAATQFSITYDGTAPTAAISSAAADPTNTTPIPVTVTFSESVAGFVAGDVIVGNGTVGNFAGGGALYTFDVTPAGPGLVTVNVAAGVTVDSAGNGNTAATQFSITYDGTAPAVTISSAAVSPTNVSPIPVTVTFSEAVTGFVAGDVVVGNGAVSNFAGGPDIYTFDVTPAADGLVTVDVPAGVATDSASTPNTAAAQFSITYDATAPAAAISSAAADPTNTTPIPVTVTFSEAVLGFAAGDIVVGNGAVGNFAGSGTLWSFDVTPAGPGLVTVDVAAGVAADSAGNGNTAAAQFSITYDATAPTVVISSSATSPTNVSPIPVTVTFSEDVTGFVAGDGVVANGAISNFAGGPAVYTFDVTPAGPGLVTVDIAAGVATDSAGNGNAAAAQFSITFSAPGLVLAPAGLTVAEGGAAGYQLSLATAPTAAPVSVTLTFDSAELTVNGSASPVVIDLSDTTPVTVNLVSLANPLVNTNRVVNITHTVTASTAPEYLVGLSSLLAVTITDGVVVQVVATLPPPPPVPVCEDHNFAEGGVVRSSTADAVGSALNCRVLYQNGSPTQWLGFDLYNAGAIGNQGVLDLGIIQAVDIFSPGGASYFQGGAVFCLRGGGTLIWLAASGIPRHPEIIGSYAVPDFPGFTCATLFEPGTLVLVRDNPLD